jgi:hypothetical protein
MVYDNLRQFVGDNIGKKDGERKKKNHRARPLFYLKSPVFIEKKAHDAGEEIIQGG